MTTRPYTPLALLFFTFFFLGVPVGGLEVPADMDAAQRRYAVVVEATADLAADTITLHLLDVADNLPYEIHRRELGALDWGVALVSLAAGTATWTDSTVTPGIAYEYQVRKPLNATETAFGYLATGLDVDLTGSRGWVILLVDQTLLAPLAAEIDRLELDLIGDGWRLTRIEAPRGVGWTDPNPGQAPVLRQAIADLWNAAPVDGKPDTLFLLGHIPVPRSGLDGQAPDGHDENRGAHPADCYYADLDGIWTDSGTAPAGMRPDHGNLPGDGRFDQDFLPSDLELAFGRVDFADLGGLYPSESEIDLLRRYLDRDHAFRHREVGLDAGRRVLFANGFVESVEMGWRTFPGIVGADDAEFVEFADFDAVGGPVAYANSFGPYALFAQNMLVPNVFDHADQGTNALFWSSDQSYFGLWGQVDSQIRGLLAAPGINLAWVWEVSPSYVFVDLGMGGTFGEAVRRTAEHSPSNLLFERPERGFDDSPLYNRQFITLHGDPTLHLFPASPPSFLGVTGDGLSNQLTWQASMETELLGYNIYRAPSTSDSFTKLNTDLVVATLFNDAVPPAGPLVYMVRAVKREIAGGTFLSASQGIFAQPEGGLIFRDGFESGDTSAW